MPSTIDSIANYGASPGDADTTPAVREALQQMQGKSATTLVFPQGRYHFWPDQAQEHYLFPSNNDPGMKRVAFPLFDLADVEIDGGGSEFVFHSNIVPFAVHHCRSVKLANFSIDWERTFHNEGEVLEAVKDSSTGMTRVDLRIPGQFPFYVEHGRLHFLYERGNNRDHMVLGNLLEFDAVRRETAYQVHDNYSVSRSHSAEDLGDGIVRLTGVFSTTPTPGNILSIGGNEREWPGIILSASAEVTLSDITIHHCGGMGVIVQCSENIRLERVKVTPSEREGRRRMISTTADATHFTSCRGLIEMQDCVFENQLDDATNVHGIYGRIANVVSARELLIEWAHGQQRGMDILHGGDSVEFVHKETLLTYHQAAITEVQRVNSQFCRVSLASPLPPEVKTSDAVASLEAAPDVTMRGCATRGNRARGILLSSPGRILIEGNHFHAPGAAISIAGDASNWFESGGVKDVTIRNNWFDNCNYGCWGRACIDICPEIEPEHRAGVGYHRNITIEGNTFDAFDPRLIMGYCVDGLTFRGNTINPSTAYPAPSTPGKPFDIENSRAVEIDGNTFTESPTR